METQQARVVKDPEWDKEEVKDRGEEEVKDRDKAEKADLLLQVPVEIVFVNNAAAQNLIL